VQASLVLVLGLLLEGADPALLMTLAGIIVLPTLMSVLLRKKLSASLDKRFKVVPRGSAEAE
jgi:hypothetical protein